jgi:hypothetical protein
VSSDWAERGLEAHAAGHHVWQVVENSTSLQSAEPLPAQERRAWADRVNVTRVPSG